MEQTYQANTGNVKHESNKGVQKQHKQACVPGMLDLELGNLTGQSDNEVHDGANGSIVVERDEWVHLQALGAQHDLDEDESHSLENDSTALEHETNPRETNLSVARQSHTENDEQDVEELGHGGVGHSPEPREEENDHGRGRLEHLDEGDGEI